MRERFIGELLNKMNETKEECIYKNRKMIIYLIISTFLFPLLSILYSKSYYLIVCLIFGIIFTYLTDRIISTNKKIFKKCDIEIKRIINQYFDEGHQNIDYWIKSSIIDLQYKKIKIINNFTIALVVLILGDMISKFTGEITNKGMNIDKIKQMFPIWIALLIILIVIILIGQSFSHFHNFKKELIWKDLKYIEKLFIEERNIRNGYIVKKRNILCILFSNNKKN